MIELLKPLLFSFLRKVVFALGAGWLLALMQKGILTDADVSRFIEILVAALLVAVPALWSFVRDWLKKRTAQ